MSNRTKSVADLVTELQEENAKLRSLQKLFQQACKKEFGYDIKTIHQMLEKQRLYEQRKLAKQGQQTAFSHRENESRW